MADIKLILDKNIENTIKSHHLDILDSMWEDIFNTLKRKYPIIMLQHTTQIVGNFANYQTPNTIKTSQISSIIQEGIRKKDFSYSIFSFLSEGEALKIKLTKSISTGHTLALLKKSLTHYSNYIQITKKK